MIRGDEPMSAIEDALMEAVLELLSEKIDKKHFVGLKNAKFKKKLYKVFANEVFYELLKEKKIDLAPGFGSLIIKQIKEKNKRVYDRTTGGMHIVRIKGSKIIYKPGDTVREFL